MKTIPLPIPRSKLEPCRWCGRRRCVEADKEGSEFRLYSLCEQAMVAWDLYVCKDDIRTGWGTLAKVVKEWNEMNSPAERKSARIAYPSLFNPQRLGTFRLR